MTKGPIESVKVDVYDQLGVSSLLDGKIISILRYGVSVHFAFSHGR